MKNRVFSLLLFVCSKGLFIPRKTQIHIYVLVYIKKIWGQISKKLLKWLFEGDRHIIFVFHLYCDFFETRSMF